MSSVTPEHRAEYFRAFERARRVLRAGDRVTVTHCPGTKRWVVFSHWCGYWLCSKTRDDYSAINVSKVNGVEMSFRDPPASR